MSPITHPGEADAADGPTQHVREHGRVRAGRGEVGEKVRAVPVGHLPGRWRSLGCDGGSTPAQDLGPPVCRVPSLTSLMSGTLGRCAVGA